MSKGTNSSEEYKDENMHDVIHMKQRAFKMCPLLTLIEQNDAVSVSFVRAFNSNSSGVSANIIFYL